jgi:hypothetical protein
MGNRQTRRTGRYCRAIAPHPRRSPIYNLLIANAWERIGEPVIHRIAKSALKGTHQGNERIESSLLRLMGTIAIVTIRKAGKSYKRRVQLLGPSDESLEKDGFLHYRIPRN